MNESTFDSPAPDAEISISQDAFLEIFDAAIRKRAAEIMQEFAEESKAAIIAHISENISILARDGKLSSVDDVLEYLESLA